MSILASDVITVRARKIWGAALSESTDFVADTSPLAFLTDALRTLYSARPDAAIDDDGNYNDFAVVTAIGQSIPVSEKWLPYLTDYVVGRGFQMDGENPAHAERADKHFGMAKEELSV